MTDRTRTLTVVLSEDVSVDSVWLRDVIRGILRYQGVDDVLVGPTPDLIARVAAKNELRRDIMAAVEEVLERR